MAKEITHRVDPEFKHKLSEDGAGETIKFCYQCGTCTANCPIASLMDIYRPNKIVQLARLGIRAVPSSNAVLLCSACTLCTKNCPQGVKVHSIMNALKDISVSEGTSQEFLSHGFNEVLADLGEAIPFPVIYSWICMRPADNKADAGKFDKSVLEFLNSSLHHTDKPVGLPIDKNRKGVAVVGSGPTGLTAAWKLCKMGIPVTVFESLPEPGGMLRVGIPEYRLPKEVLDKEIKNIENMGVEIKTNTPINQDWLNELMSLKDYEAILLAFGAHATKRLRIEGESMEGVVSALDLLCEYNLNGHAQVGKNVVVIGGGNVAIDAARTAKRCGAETVQLYCLESKDEMPAHKWEIEEAIAEGVIMNPSWGPKRMLGDGCKVTGVEFIRCTSVFDENKRFSPRFNETKTKKAEADMVVSAIGQSPDLSLLEKKVGTFRGTVVVDPMTMETNIPGVFAGGDAVLGAGSVIEAIVAGKLAAAAISNYINNVNPKK